MAGLWEPIDGVFTATAAPLLPTLAWLENLGGSSFFTTVFGALAGAFAGAWAAQYIAEQNKLREQLTKEIRDTNAAIVLSLGVFNIAVSLKKQHIHPLVTDYQESCRIFREATEQLKANITPTEMPQINLLDIQEIAPPITHLQDMVLGRLSTAGRSLASVTALVDAVVNINYALSRRNALIAKFKDGDLPKGARKEHLYFGLPYGDGQTNAEYPHIIEGISLYTNDVIFFSAKLCEDLREHGQLLVKKYEKGLRGQVPALHGIDVAKAQKEGWVPDEADYEAWTAGFRETAKKPQHWLSRIFRRS